MLPFPHFRQFEAKDCGPACLKMICSHFNKDVSIQSIREKTFFDGKEVSMLDLTLAAESLGFTTLSVTLTIHEFIEKAVLPGIVIYDNKHFMIVYKISVEGDHTFIHIADPATELLIFTLERFKGGWLTYHKNGMKKGSILMLEPEKALIPK